VKYGALTQLYAGTSPDITADKNGAYLVPLAQFTNNLPHAKAKDEELQKKVWEWNEAAMKKAGAD
jgi:retinol dehydrogenase-12